MKEIVQEKMNELVDLYQFELDPKDWNDVFTESAKRIDINLYNDTIERLNNRIEHLNDELDDAEDEIAELQEKLNVK